VEPCSWDAQPWLCLYAEAKQWQTGIGALFGFLALMGAALFNFYLNRRRDARLRQEEMVSVAAALYGEILLLRNELALLSRVLARFGIDNRDLSESDMLHYSPSVPLLYPPLADKLGLLPSDLLLGITQFYANVEGARRGLESYYRKQTEGIQFAASVVLEDGVAGVHDVKPVLLRIQQLASIPEAKDPDTGMAEAILENERLRFEEQRGLNSR
jgi:hypothetical protein